MKTDWRQPLSQPRLDPCDHVVEHPVALGGIELEALGHQVLIGVAEDLHPAHALEDLFEQIGERYGVTLKGVPTVGDSARDLIAGATAGCEPHLVLSGKSAKLRGQPLPDNFPASTRVHENLLAFADYLVSRDGTA